MTTEYAATTEAIRRRYGDFALVMFKERQETAESQQGRSHLTYGVNRRWIEYRSHGNEAVLTRREIRFDGSGTTSSCSVL